MTAEETCRHEAGHACAAALLGMSVRLIDTVPRHELTPGGGLCTIFGVVRHSGERIVDRESARNRMLVILCGPIESAESWLDVPHWPLDEHADTTDERNLWALADWLGYDRSDYHEVLTDAIELTLTREYQMLHMAVTGMLDYTPRIDAVLFEQLHEITRGL
jgi:hypothetical protein